VGDAGQQEAQPATAVWASAVTTMPRATARTAFAARTAALSPLPGEAAQEPADAQPAFSPLAKRTPAITTVRMNCTTAEPTPPARGRDPAQGLPQVRHDPRREGVGGPRRRCATPRRAGGRRTAGRLPRRAEGEPLLRDRPCEPGDAVRVVRDGGDAHPDGDDQRRDEHDHHHRHRRPPAARPDAPGSRGGPATRRWRSSSPRRSTPRTAAGSRGSRRPSRGWRRRRA